MSKKTSPPGHDYCATLSFGQGPVLEARSRLAMEIARLEGAEAVLEQFIDEAYRAIPHNATYVEGEFFRGQHSVVDRARAKVGLVRIELHRLRVRLTEKAP